MISNRVVLIHFASMALLLGSLPLRAEPTAEDLNAALGIPLFSAGLLWDDDAAATAQRLGWPKESETSTDSSFRKYPGAEERVFGVRPYSLVLFGTEGKASGLSMIFANKGDAVDVAPVAGDKLDPRALKKQMKSCEAAISQDKTTIAAALTSILGNPVNARFGQGRQTRESTERWDWNGHAILLAAPPGEYVAVRILPLEVADARGKSRLPDAELRVRLESRIERRPNGDVILKDIPMVNQGPKGYCVPATWERVMRYMAIPADMYVLAMAGNTGAGGGTSVDEIIAGVREAVISSGRRLDPQKARISTSTISKSINRGLPIMWTMYSMDEVNAALNQRIKERADMTDPVSWRKHLESARKGAKKINTNPEDGHMCMIIGYNEKTGEIAVSDSWGPEYAERWITEEEANAISQGSLMVINI